MNENKPDLGNIFGDVMGNLMGAAAPMMTGLIKSVLSPQVIKSLVGMLPTILNAAVDTISSIDLGEILSSTVSAILPVLMRLLDPILDMLGPIIEGLLDMLSHVLKIVEPILNAIGPILNTLRNIISPLLGALTKGLGSLGSSS